MVKGRVTGPEVRARGPWGHEARGPWSHGARGPGSRDACAGSTGPPAFGEAAAPRGVDSAQRGVGDQARSGVGGRGGVRAASDVCRVELGDLRAGARERKTICAVWEGVLPERRDVEVKGRKHMGGGWVKQPKGAKGLKIWRPQESQGKSSCSLQLGFAEEFVPILLQQGSRANWKLVVQVAVEYSMICLHPSPARRVECVALNSGG